MEKQLATDCTLTDILYELISNKHNCADVQMEIGDFIVSVQVGIKNIVKKEK